MKVKAVSGAFFTLSLYLAASANASSIIVLNAANTAASRIQAEKQFERVESKAMSQPDSWKAYQMVSEVAPENTNAELRNRYRSLSVSLVIKAAMACSPEALRVIERNDVIEFRILRSSLASACRNNK